MKNMMSKNMYKKYDVRGGCIKSYVIGCIIKNMM